MNHTFRIFRKFCARMTHFGEIIEYVDDNPVNLMVPSDLTKTVSILYYRPPKFQSYENFINQSPVNQNPTPKAQIHQAQTPKAKNHKARKYKPRPPKPKNQSPKTKPQIHTTSPRKNTGIHFNTKSNKIDSIKYQHQTQ